MAHYPTAALVMLTLSPVSGVLPDESQDGDKERVNLLVIQTDEHHYGTLGWHRVR